MRTEHLRVWIDAENREETTFATSWINMVDLIQTAFRDDLLEEEFTCQTIFLIPKRNVDFRGIRLVEVIWKTAAVIFNCRLGMTINFAHGVVHGFRTIRGMGTAYLEANMTQHLGAMREKVLYEILLYLHKSNNDIDKYSCLEILSGYGVGSQAIHLLRRYCYCLIMVTKARGYYGTKLKEYRGSHREPPPP